YQAVLAIIDRAANAAIEVRRERRRLDLHGISNINAVKLGQVPIERLEAVPDIDNLSMVRGEDPVDDAEALQPLVMLAGVAIFEQSSVSRLLEIDPIYRRWNDVDMGDVEYRPAE